MEGKSSSGTAVEGARRWPIARRRLRVRGHAAGRGRRAGARQGHPRCPPRHVPGRTAAGQDPGGSTIAQQLAKQLYGHATSLPATLREIGLGVKLSLHFSNPQVLGLYLNAVCYGHGFWGEMAAARGYFGVFPARLDWAQAALLAGLPQAPSAYDPLVHFDEAKERQRHVLDQLVVNHYLTRAQADAAFAQRLPLRRGSPQSAGP